MKAQVRVGDVEIAVAGMNLTMKELRSLVRTAASISVAIAPQASEGSAPIGFTVITERSSTDTADGEYYEDE
jgi:hypothetical protein